MVYNSNLIIPVVLYHIKLADPLNILYSDNSFDNFSTTFRFVCSSFPPKS